jgi:putative FmdB family regulatory protein
MDFSKERTGNNSVPTYSMICDSCNHQFEEYRFFSEGEPPACPQCGCENGKSFHQKWSDNRPGGWVYGEDHATTVGQQAQYNAKRAGKERLEMMADEQNRRPTGWNKRLGKEAPVPETPWWRDGSTEGLPKMEKPLDLKEVKNVENYIMEGKK